MEDSKKMETTIEGLNVPEQKDEESSFNLRTVYSIFILNWPWFLLSLFIFVCGALIYLRYADPVYSLSMKMYIKDEMNNRRPSNYLVHFFYMNLLIY